MGVGINHAAESQKVWEHVGEDFIAEEGWTEATAIMGTLDALRHATLALVEQQRIANLIAYAQLLEMQYAEAAKHGTEFNWDTRAASNARHGIALDRIREGLEL